MINLISNRRQSLDPLRTSWVRPPASSVGHPLIFSVTESLLTGDCLLRPDPDTSLAPTAWQQLAESVAHEKSLTPFPAAVLYRRWQQGLAAVAVHQGCIIGHISCMPIFHQTTRSQVERALRGDQPQGASVWPAIEMFELLTGWTHPDWRRRKLSLHLCHRGARWIACSGAPRMAHPGLGCHSVCQQHDRRERRRPAASGMACHQSCALQRIGHCPPGGHRP